MSIDVQENRDWLVGFHEDAFDVRCQRCRMPFQASGYAVAAPPEFYGLLEALGGALDEIERLSQALVDLEKRTVPREFSLTQQDVIVKQGRELERLRAEVQVRS